MSKVDSMSSDNIQGVAERHLVETSFVKTDGWLAYRSALRRQNILFVTVSDNSIWNIPQDIYLEIARG